MKKANFLNFFIRNLVHFDTETEIFEKNYIENWKFHRTTEILKTFSKHFPDIFFKVSSTFMICIFEFPSFWLKNGENWLITFLDSSFFLFS